MPSPLNPKSQLIRGAIWTVGTRWLIKSMGFINTVIMARLLVPEDYGIVALGMLVVSLIQTFLDFSATIALLRKQHVTREEIDSAWTLRLIQGCIAGILTILCTPLAARFFTEPRLLSLLPIFALCIAISGASSVGQTLALRKFNYSLDFKINTIGKLSSVIATIISGFLLRDYRALMLGIVAGYIIPFILSYLFHPYRPRWNTKHLGEIWQVTKWLLISQIAGFLMRKSDELIAGTIGTTMEFGTYNVGADLGQVAVAEVGPAMQRAILPTLASIKHDVARTRNAVIKSFSAVSTVIWPIAIGFSAISTDATKLILGEKWASATPYVSTFSIIAALQSSTGPFRSYLTLLGHTKIQSTIAWFELTIFCLTALFLTPRFHLLGLAYARLISGVAANVYLWLVTKKYCSIKITTIFENLFRPLLSSIIMWSILTSYTTSLPWPYIHRIILSTSCGAIIYTTLILASWILFGKPEGLESTIIEKLSNISLRQK